jgi:hypothetical protein
MANQSTPKAEPKADPKSDAKDSKSIELQKAVDAAYRERDSALARVRDMAQKLDKLEKENGQLRSLTQKLRDDAPPELGEGAYVLARSVTFGNADTKEMVEARPGDVVVMVPEDGKPGGTTRDCDSIMKRLGPGYRAYPITRNTLDELQRKDMLRG